MHVDFFAEFSTKLKQRHFFRQFKDHNSGREHENYTNDPIFFIYSFCYTYFLPRATDSDSSSYFSRKQTPEVTKNLYYVLSTRRIQIPIFLGSSSWTVLEVEESFMHSLSAFLLHFGNKKITFKSPFELYFHPFIIEFFWFA